MSLTTLQLIAVWIIPILLAITLHEVAHARVAYYFGDHDLKKAGRLSLNPLKHIEFLGTILVPLIMVMVTGFAIGWAKPVIINPNNLKNPIKNMPWIAIAGPLSNFFMALLWALLLRFIFIFDAESSFTLFFAYMAIAGVLINIILMVFNLLPIPPLDGSNVVMPLLPRKIAIMYQKFAPYGFYLIIILMLLGVLGIILNPLINTILNSLVVVSGINPSIFSGFIQTLN